jgi:hypothetical protein
VATLDGALHVDEEMAHLAEALLHAPVDTPRQLELLGQSTRAYSEAVMARRPTHSSFSTHEELMALCEWGRLVSESFEIARAVEVRLHAARLDTELTSFLQAATEGIQP